MIPLQELVSLQGRRALITGAASGIGRAIALRLAEAGAEVMLLDLDREGLAKVQAEVEALGRRASLWPLDLAQQAEVEAFWARLPAENLPDTLVNNAGVYPSQDLVRTEAEAIQRTLRVNLEAVLWMCRGFIQRRQGQGGVILNVSSIEAILPFKAHLVPYSVAKAGVLALTRGLARDYGPQGFRVNALLPGGVRTPGTERLMRAALRGLRLELIKTGYEFHSRLPLKRWGHPDEVARAALFLVSELASYVQGVALPVDGGFLSA